MNDAVSRVFKYKVVAGVMLLVLMGFVISEARAITILGDDIACASLANASVEAVMYRDMGESWEENLPYLMKALQNAKGSPDSFVKDDDDVALVIDLFGEIWKQNASVEDTMNAVHMGCMSRRSVSF